MKNDLLFKLAEEIPDDKSKTNDSEPKGETSNSDKKKLDKKPPFQKNNKKPNESNGAPDDAENTNGFKKTKVPEGKTEKPGNNGDKEGDEGLEKNENNAGPEGPKGPLGVEGVAGQGGAINPIAIFDFFEQNPISSDQEFHAFCEQNGFDTHGAEAVAYGMAGKYIQLVRGGKSKGMDPNSVDPQQLQMGIEVEGEHTDDPATRKKIALDHLAEDPQYYTHLKDMESQSKAAVTPTENQNEQEKKPTQKDTNQSPASGQQADTRNEGSMK